MPTTIHATQRVKYKRKIILATFVIVLSFVSVVILSWRFFQSRGEDNEIRAAFEQVAAQVPLSWQKTGEYWQGTQTGFLFDTSVRNFVTDYTAIPSRELSTSILQRAAASNVSCDHFENREMCSGRLGKQCVYVTYATNIDGPRLVKVGTNTNTNGNCG